MHLHAAINAMLGAVSYMTYICCDQKWPCVIVQSVNFLTPSVVLQVTCDPCSCAWQAALWSALHNFLGVEVVRGTTDVNACLMLYWMCKAHWVHFLWRKALHKNDLLLLYIYCHKCCFSSIPICDCTHLSRIFAYCVHVAVKVGLRREYFHLGCTRLLP